MLRDLDLRVFHLINDLAGQSWSLDRIVGSAQALYLLGGGMLLGLYWLFWFRRGPDQQDRKATILAAIMGALAALVIARTLSAALPFRERPIYDAAIAVRSPSIPIHPNLEDWSAFPSDTATYFVALAAGFWFLRRLWGAILLVWVLVYLCLPRVFLAIHYPSDIVAGALIGILSVASLQRAAVKSWIARPILAFEQAHSDLFYPLMFLVSYEFVVVFADIRIPLRAVSHAFRHYGLLWTSENVSLLAVWVCTLAVVCPVAIALHCRRRARMAQSGAGRHGGGGTNFASTQSSEIAAK